jgi:hypothetical protein
MPRKKPPSKRYRWRLPNGRDRPCAFSKPIEMRFGKVDLKLHMNPAGENIYRPAVGVVGRVGDELIVDGDARESG